MYANNETVNKIVAYEWDMFHAVNDGEARASCQEDYDTFRGMRSAQFAAWSQDAAESYLDDLAAAKLTGRNLAEEKYIHMMKNTEPYKYETLVARAVLPGADAAVVAKEISDRLLTQTVALHAELPYVSGAGRPLHSTQDFSGVTSIETYQLGELYTYSEKTLTALREHVLALENAGESLARKILENTVAFYGYTSLEAAEKVTKERIDSIGIQISYGCQSDEECAI